MMNQEQVAAAADKIFERLAGDDDIAVIAAAACTTFPEIPAEHFQTWARHMTRKMEFDKPGLPQPADKNRYRERLQQLNVALVKCEAYLQAVARYHDWKEAQSAQSTQDPA